MKIITGTLYEDVRTFMVISSIILIINRNVSDRIVEKIKTHILYSAIFFFENRAIYDRM